MNRTRAIAVYALLMLAPLARAGAQDSGGQILVKIDLGNGACTPTVSATAGSQTVDVKAKVVKGGRELTSQDAEVKKLTFVLKATDGGLTALTPGTARTMLVSLSGGPGRLSDFNDKKLLVKRDTETICEVALSAARTSVGGGSQNCAQTLLDATQAAKAYIGGHPEVRTHTEPDALTHKSVVIAILPNGEVYGRYPHDLTERDKVNLVAIVPSTAKVEWTSVTCNAPPLWRNLTTEKAPGVEQAAEEQPTRVTPAQPEPRWHPPFGHGCDASIDYSIKITLDGCEDSAIAKTNSVPTQKVYDFLLGAGFGYDFGSPVDFTTQPRANASGTTDKVLVRTRDQTGLKPIVTLSYFPFGANPNNWGYRNYISPFVGLDPTRVDKGAIAGINLQPFGLGFSLLAGVSVFQSEKLSAPVGLKPGNVVPSGTDVSTRNTFNSDGIGFYLGANFTTESLKLLFSKGAEVFGASSDGGSS